VNKTVFIALDQDVLSFLHWAHHVLAIFSKVHEFVPNSIFSLRSACFVIFALGAPLFCDFQQSARVCTKQRFQPKISTFYSFSHWAYHFLHFSAKRTSLYKAVFSAGDQNVLSFLFLAYYFLAIFSKVHGFLQNNVFSPTSARFVIFALGTPLLSNFQQSA